MTSNSRCSSIVLAVTGALLLTGCSKSKKGADQPQDAQPHAQITGPKGGIPRKIDTIRVTNDLRQIGFAYQNCEAATGRPPKGVDGLLAYLDNDPKLTEALRSGQYVLKTKAHAAGPSNTIVAYEKDADEEGKRYVVFANITVKPLTDKEFEAALKEQGQ